jgi:hypothetical protein
LLEIAQHEHISPLRVQPLDEPAQPCILLLRRGAAFGRWRALIREELELDAGRVDAPVRLTSALGARAVERDIRGHLTQPCANGKLAVERG